MDLLKYIILLMIYLRSR